MAWMFSSRTALLRCFFFVSLLLSLPSYAQVQLSFHSINGSVFWGGGRWPHAFISLNGSLLRDGQKISENYGFSAIKASPAMLTGSVAHEIYIEKEEFIGKSNFHFSITISDDQYDKIIQLMEKWRDAPGKYYNLNSRNCIHFSGSVAEIVGIEVEYPKKLRRKPKRWLNFIGELNPHLGAKKVR